MKELEMTEKQEKILVVDDEASIRSLIRNMLSEDYTILEASNGEEAISIAREQKPDLILMDIMMPKMDGYAACSEIKNDQATKVIPVVFISGLGQELNKELTKKTSADGYIAKPFSLADLLTVIGQFLKGHQ